MELFQDRILTIHTIYDQYNNEGLAGFILSENLDC
jgi:hypothetical protein